MRQNPIDQQTNSTVQIDGQSGTLTLTDPFTQQTRRLALADGTFLKVLFKKLGSSAASYDYGVQWGRRVYADLTATLHEHPIASVSRPEEYLKDEFVEMLNSRMSYTGLGQFRITEGNHFYVVDLRNAIVCDLKDTAKTSFNMLMAGFLAGLLGKLAAKDLTCVPLSSDPSPEKNRFALCLSKDAEDLRKRVASGKSDADILSDFKNGHIL